MSEDTFSHFDRIPACDKHMEVHTDGQTSCDSTVYTMHNIAQ